MKRRTISSNEINLVSMLVLLVGATYLLMRVMVLGLSLYFTGILLFSIHLNRKRKTRKMNVPGESILISSNEMEIHVNGKAKGNLRNFLSLVSESLVFGVENRLNITFYTWHLTPKYLKATLGDSIIISKPRTFEKIAQLVFNRHYYRAAFKKKSNNKRINPLIKVNVEWEKVNQETFDKLRSKSKSA
ncbi:hypothetical protein NSQ20_25495 [Paenibacillus sp. FSL K6-1122]|uniref:hypothetical protein n=1 Tax=Paenibacillus sp. FSL K6-1122 TaxID=2954512 RepID=UPI0030EE163A